MRDDFSAELSNEVSNKVSVRLEKDAHELGGTDLQIELVGVFFFDESEIVGIELIIRIFSFFVGLELVVLLDSF